MENSIASKSADQVSMESTQSGNLENEEAIVDGKALTESTASITNPTENELINLDEIELSDEDTWLYTSPNKNDEENDISPYKWLRKDVEDPNNLQLQIAKTALVCKLDELDILNSVSKNQVPASKPIGNNRSPTASSLDKSCDIFTKNSEARTIKHDFANAPGDKNTQFRSKPQSLDIESTPQKSHPPVLHTSSDVTDILERARRQEESLKESSSKFFSQASRTFPRGTCPPTMYASSKLQKPSSIEALHACHGDQETGGSISMKANQRTISSSPNHSPFGSNVSLNFPHDVHRGSLPNLNKGYYSLKRKPKRPNESRIQCPLPIYPRNEMSGAASREAARFPSTKLSPRSPSSSFGESQTLPSSYRTKPKGMPSSNREFASCTTLRRESAPSPKCQRNPPLMLGSRRESAGGIPQQRDIPNGKAAVYQLSPKNNSLPLSQQFAASAPSLHDSVSLNHLLPDSNISPIREYPRQALRSPVKRQPLSSVHNYSADRESAPVVQKNGELRKSSLPSKIPSPASRSGIPVPSQLIPRPSQSSNGWDRNFY